MVVAWYGWSGGRVPSGRLQIKYAQIKAVKLLADLIPRSIRKL